MLNPFPSGGGENLIAHKPAEMESCTITASMLVMLVKEIWQTSFRFALWANLS